MISACSLTFLSDAEAMGPAVMVVIMRRHEVLAEISQWGDGSSREGGSGMEVMLIVDGDGRGDNNGIGDCDDENEGSDGGAGGDGDDGSTTVGNSGSGDGIWW